MIDPPLLPRQLFFFTMSLRPDLLEPGKATMADIEHMKSAIQQTLDKAVKTYTEELKYHATEAYFDSKTTRVLWQILESEWLCEYAKALNSLCLQNEESPLQFG